MLISQHLGNLGNHDFGLESGRRESYGGVWTTILHGMSSQIEWNQSWTWKPQSFFGGGGSGGRRIHPLH